MLGLHELPLGTTPGTAPMIPDGTWVVELASPMNESVGQVRFREGVSDPMPGRLLRRIVAALGASIVRACRVEDGLIIGEPPEGWADVERVGGLEAAPAPTLPATPPEEPDDESPEADAPEAEAPASAAGDTLPPPSLAEAGREELKAIAREHGLDTRVDLRAKTEVLRSALQALLGSDGD